MELEGQAESFRKRGLGVAALSYDSVGVLKDFADRRQITFPLLSDAGSAIIRRFGLLNPDYPEGDIGHGVPFPGTFVTDASGIVRGKYFEEGYRERRTAGSVLLLTGEALVGAGEARTEHFRLRTSASNSQIAPGHRVTLALHFAMGEKRHAYAPGVSGYRPLSLRLEPHPLLKFDETLYPPPRSYVFRPLKETVPVFAGRFRITRDVTLATGKEVAALLESPEPSLTLAGSLDYQVCSDKVCYPPSSLPLSWTFKVVPLDRERPPEELRRQPSKP